MPSNSIAGSAKQEKHSSSISTKACSTTSAKNKKPDEGSVCASCNEKSCWGELTTYTGQYKMDKRQYVKFE